MAIDTSSLRAILHSKVANIPVPIVLALGVGGLAYYIYRKNQASGATSATDAANGPASSGIDSITNPLPTLNQTFITNGPTTPTTGTTSGGGATDGTPATGGGTANIPTNTPGLLLTSHQAHLSHLANLGQIPESQYLSSLDAHQLHVLHMNHVANKVA